MKIRKLVYDIIQIILASLEWLGLFCLMMIVTRKSYLISGIVIGVLFLLTVFVFIINIIYQNKYDKLLKVFNEEDDDNYDYLALKLQKELDNLGYNLTIKVMDFNVNSPAVNIGKFIFISRTYLNYLVDVNNSLDLELLWAVIFHEIGHAQSGISSSKIGYLRLSLSVSGFIRFYLNNQANKRKKSWLYYPMLGLFFMISLINLSFLFFKNDEIFANNYVCKNSLFGIHLAKYYSRQTNDKKPIHDIYHPSIKKMFQKMVKHFNQIDQTNIYEDQDILVYEYTEVNMAQLEKLGSNNDHRALYELGINYYTGKFLDYDKGKAINYILKAYDLGNQQALKFLFYYDKAYIKQQDLIANLANQNELLEKRYNTLYNHNGLLTKAALDEFLDGAKMGNQFASSLYLKHLLVTNYSPLPAIEFYQSITKTYDFFNFYKERWYDNFEYIKTLETKGVTSISILRIKLEKDLETRYQLLWRYIKTRLESNNDVANISQAIITILERNPNAFLQIIKQDIQEYFTINYHIKVDNEIIQ